jgi:hypothetical protein
VSRSIGSLVLAATAVSAATATAAPVQSCPTLLAVEEAVLTPTTPDGDFGRSVSIDGDWALVAGRPKTRSARSTFYERTAQGWVMRTESSSALSVDLDGDQAVLGLHWNSFRADVLDRSGSSWSITSTVNYQGCPHDDFGESIAIQGTVVAAGVPETIPFFGTVAVYDKVGGVWNRRYWMDVGFLLGQTLDMDGKWVVSGGSMGGAYDHDVLRDNRCCVQADLAA